MPAMIARLGLVSAFCLAAANAQDSGPRALADKAVPPGGDFYSFIQLRDRTADLAAWFSSTAASRSDDPGARPAPAAPLISALGLDSLQCAALRSDRDGEVWRNRAVLVLAPEPAGLMKLVAAPATDFIAPATLPAGLDFVWEQRLPLATLPETGEAVVKALGDSGFNAQWRAAMAGPLPLKDLPLPMADLLKRMDTRVLVAARLRTRAVAPKPKAPAPAAGGKPAAINPAVAVAGAKNAATVSPPGNASLFDAASAAVAGTKAPAGSTPAGKASAATPLPETILEFACLVEKGGFLFSAAERAAAGTPDGPRKEASGQLQLLKLSPGAGPDAPQPILAHDPATDRLWFATHPAFLQACLKPASPLAKDPAFAAALAGLPAKGSLLAYASPAFSRAAAARDWPILTASAIPQAAVLATTPEGLVATANLDSPWLDSLAGSTLTLGRDGTLASLPPGPPGPEALPDDDLAGPDDLIKENLQLIIAAGTGWLTAHPAAKDVTYSKLIEDGWLYSITPAGGETYQNLSLTRKGGKLATRTATGRTLSAEYPELVD